MEAVVKQWELALETLRALDINTIFIAYAALGLMAVLPIYIGSYRSIKFVPKQKDEEEEEFFSFEDAKMFPFIGSASLFGLYLIFKYFDKDIVNYIVTAYFTLLGVGTSSVALLDISRYLSGMELKGTYLLGLHAREKGSGEYSIEKFTYYFGYYHIFLLVVSSVLGGYYAYSKHWIVSNFYGEAFSVSAVQLLNLDSFQTGMLLLAGLFFYDIFWVFGTDVMVTVAKNFEAPIKVVFPKDIFEILQRGLFDQSGEKIAFTMLGLGDIVIPGIFVALCLQFDYHMHKKRTAKGKLVTTGSGRFKFPKPYFTSCFLAYCAGLFTTVYIMHNFKAAQPALLYLSPACTLTPLVVAFFRGEIKDMFSFKPQEEAEEQKKAEAKKS
ncbi:MAG: hypothetical protein SGCHY_005558, partial [Lobulomycetales sp.]